MNYDNQSLKELSRNKWNQLYENHFCLIKKFQEDLHIENTDDTVFYPLSGVDFPHMYYFFPNAKKYIMVGLENLGEISIHNEDSKDDVMKLLDEYCTTQYFSRTGMKIFCKSDDNEKSRLGITLLLFVSMIGLCIDDICTIKLNSQGNIEKYDGVRKWHDQEYMGIRIKFHKENESTSRELIYLKMELSDELNTTQKIFFDKNLNKMSMFLKASEYSLQLNKYSMLNNYFISKSNVVIQDDSGIPYKNFNKIEWVCKLYGNYRGRVIIPKTPDVPDQVDLLHDFEHTPNKELPFNFGYPHGFGAIVRSKNPNVKVICGSDIGPKPSNLMVLIRKNIFF